MLPVEKSAKKLLKKQKRDEYVINQSINLYLLMNVSYKTLIFIALLIVYVIIIVFSFKMIT